MDDFLNDVQSLSDMACRRNSPRFDADAVMRSVYAATPLSRVIEYRTGFLSAMAATAAAASIIITISAFSAWTDINNPFLAMGNFVNPMGWLQ